MTVDIDSGSGFCYGVVRAIGMAEEALRRYGTLYSLGDIVHNGEEVSRLSRNGLRVIDRQTFQSLCDSTILIRAHGEPPETYRCAERNRNTLLDATCPVVLHLQRKVRQAYLDYCPINGQIVIYGKPGHAEVNGLVGQTGDTAVVVEKPEDIGKIDVNRPIQLFAQTTQSTAGLHRIRQAVQEAREKAGVPPDIPFLVHDTTCRQVANRVTQIAAFAASHDTVVFVGGEKSSNGKILFDVCRQNNPSAHFASRTEDLQPDWFLHADRVGVCGATSTPHWLMNDIADRIRAFATEKRPSSEQPKDSIL